MAFEVFKLKGISEQIRNDFIRGVEEKLEARLAKEAVEKEAAKAVAKEAAEKAAAKAVAREKAEVEEAMATEVAQKAVEDAENTNEVSLTQGESSTTDLAPLFIKTLEELQKEQQLVRA